jgi:hypothetical protein
MAYEVATFRERLRYKEIWVVGADRWRNPDEDLPADFEARRAEHYRELRKPLDAEAFTGPLREEMRAELATLETALPAAAGGDLLRGDAKDKKESQVRQRAIHAVLDEPRRNGAPPLAMQLR